MSELPLITTIAAAFAVAWAFGLLTQWLRLSPIVGYLAAGVVIGRHTPGFVGDEQIAHQLAEVGVILLMFGVGLHFHLKDLLAVKGVAVPGAIGQVIGATVCSVLLFSLVGMPFQKSVVVGLALSVASTVVLMRVLMDSGVMHTPEGHVAVGWLLMEDLLTVMVLVVIPTIGHAPGTEAVAADVHPFIPIVWALGKLAILLVIVLVFGMRVVPWVLEKVARLRSRELFTLTVLVFSISVAAGAYAVFGVSMALGAFLAGMMVAQSPVSHQAAADALPLRDAFAVIFFVSVGMIFNPMYLVQQPLLILISLVVILIVKPVSALILVALAGWSVRTGLTVALALAQIGEFSFILSEVARAHGLISDASHSVLVACAMLTITTNPMVYRLLPHFEKGIQKQPWLWKLLNFRSDRRIRKLNREVAASVVTPASPEERLAVVIGYGPVGRTVNRLLRNAGLRTVIIDMNMDAVNEANRSGQQAIYGDGSREAILEQAGVARASHLVVTLPQSAGASVIIYAARNLNRHLRILVRARYLGERKQLEDAGASAAVFEEGEAAIALARLVLADFGASREMVESTVLDLRLRLLLDNVSNLNHQRVHHLMVPWPKVRCLLSTDTLEQVHRQIAEEHFSRWPVVKTPGSAPIGYLLARDLVGESTTGQEWTRLIRPLAKVRMDEDVHTVLTRLQDAGNPLCLVESLSRPVGIVTLEDLLEQVIGRIEDEYPREVEVSLGDALQAGGVKINLLAETPDEAIQELSTLIPAGSLPRNAHIAENAIEREHQFSTDVGMGVAIPHARCPELRKPVIAYGYSVNGIVFNAQSPDPVRFVFLLVTPAEKPELQLVMLGKIASIMGNPDIPRQLQEANSSMDVIDVLTR